MVVSGCDVSCVHAVANCPFAMRHTGVEPNMGWIMILYNTIVLLFKKVRLRRLAYYALLKAINSDSNF